MGSFQKQEQATPTVSAWKEIKTGFLYGFFSMAGGLTMATLYINREKVKRVVRYAIQEAR